ncbi:MurR/RpiR family transcriptional regulator [Oceanicola sp. S124]|uniref:MurR/RpiR family transcriptional regulator n=1 Tax=Oceanicola sp. S124 TaxID=1042378 RepID=UPI0002DDEA45|nr:MurR/RpiR family transcriptional regulator [Oceanicola sp. S124]
MNDRGPEGKAETGVPPRSFDELRQMIAAKPGELPRRLSQAAQFALANPDDIALGTAASVATAAGVQPSTLIRLAQHFGYQGFSDFQTVFRERLKSRASVYEDRLRQIETDVAGDTYESALLNGFFRAARQSLDGVSASMDSAVFGSAVSVLAKADTIFLVSRRRAYPLAAQMAYTFGTLGIRTMMVDSAMAVDSEIVRTAGPRDAAVVCSFAPYTPATIGLAEELAEAGVPIIAITDSALSPLAPLASHWFEVAEQAFNGFRSLSASMALTMALPVAVAERRRLGG